METKTIISDNGVKTTMTLVDEFEQPPMLLDAKITGIGFILPRDEGCFEFSLENEIALRDIWIKPKE